MAKRGDYTQGPVGPLLRQLVWPTCIGLIASLTFNLVDTALVGQLGTQPLAAMGFCFPVIFLVSGLSLGLAVGVGAQVSQRVGAGDIAGARRLFTHLSLLVVALSLPLSLIGQATIEPTFRFLGAQPALIPDIQAYMHLWYWGILPVMAAPLLNAALRSMGNTRFPGLSMAAASVLNVIVSPILIFGLFGAPELGIAGAAAGTLAARVALTAAGLGLLLIQHQMISLSSIARRDIRADIGKVLSIGLPAFVAQAMNPVALAIITALLALYGVEWVAAFTVGSRIEMLMFIPLMGLQVAIVPFSGQNAGAGKAERIRSAWRLCLISATGWAVLSFTIAVLLWPYAMPLFSDNTNVAQAAAHYIALISLGFLGRGILMCASGLLSATGRPGLSAGLAIIRVIIIASLGPLLGQVYGAIGIFFAALASDFLSGFVSFVVTRRHLQRPL